MAFNFNWLPLDTTSSSSASFYTQAKSLLTAALNKSAKPPIIVDDILVDDLNLGMSAPDLEILEIGDIAEDKFRGIFRMSYAGDAFLTLRTKVQANPLNTYLSTTPSFTSPGPVSASSPLTIPVQITLSDFKLSGFVILVFSKAKGITLVFRNDPLESLKVSSTFDSIPFIASYLQQEIERQVRRIFQEDLPVAVHRLSLRLWNPEYASSLDLETTLPSRPPSPARPESPEDEGVNPLLPNVDNPADDVLSHANLQHIGGLVASQNTLSLTTPRLKDVVFRAWASGASQTSQTVWDRDLILPTDNADPETRSIASTRPSLSASTSSASVPAATPRTPLRRKKKHRVVNLRQSTPAISTAPSPAPTPTPSIPSTPAASIPPTPAPIPESAVVEDYFELDPPKPQHKREDSIDYGSDASTGPPRAHEQTLQQAFLQKLVREMRATLKAERERKGGLGSSHRWQVEKELENIEGDQEGLPAYDD